MTTHDDEAIRAALENEWSAILDKQTERWSQECDELRAQLAATREALEHLRSGASMQIANKEEMSPYFVMQLCERALSSRNVPSQSKGEGGAQPKTKQQER